MLQEHMARYDCIAVYIMADRRNGTFYCGVTSDLPTRVWLHRTGASEGFTKRYGCKLLVWWEPHADMRSAIAREKQIKSWRRIWKIDLIESKNHLWRDLYPDLIPGAVIPDSAQR